MTEIETGLVSDALDRIEADLAAIWRPAPGAPPRTRACTMNLVVSAGERPDEPTLARLDVVADTHPARTIVLWSHARSAPWSVDEEVTALCRKGDDGEIVCVERVNIGLGSMAARRVPSILTTLAIPEVPVVAMPLADATQPLVSPLVGLADRWIFDTRTTAIEKLAPHVARARGMVTDLGWIEGFPWREMTARFFDAPETAGAVRCIERVEIVHGDRPGGGLPSDVRLFVGWLASRLGWRLEGRSAIGPGGEVFLLTTRKPVPARKVGALQSIRLDARTAGAARARLRVERDPDDAGFRWSAIVGERVLAEHRFRLTERDEAWLLTRALDVSEPDRVLREAFAAADGWRRA